MKSLSDLTVNQIKALADITMLEIDTRVLFIGDMPAAQLKGFIQTLPTVDPYTKDILLKVLPDLNDGRTPVIAEDDSLDLMLLKATWCGIRAYGYHGFFAGSRGFSGGRSGREFGSFKREYIIDSMPAAQLVKDGWAIELYLQMIDNHYTSQRPTAQTTGSTGRLKTASSRIGDYWNNVLAFRHLNKDPAAWQAHCEKNKMQ